MQFTSLTLLALAAVAAADCSQSSQTKDLISAIDSLKSAAQKVDDDVKSFSAADGIQSALAIQQDEPAIESALKDVTEKTQSINVDSLQTCEAEAIASAIADVSSTVVGLLSELSSKAKDLIEVGTQTIVQGDLKNLIAPTFELESAAYQKIPCQYAASAISAFAGINAGFSSAADAYSYKMSEKAPSTPTTCAASAAGSAAATSAVASAAASSAAAAGTSAAASAATSAASAAASGAASSAAGSAASSAAASVAQPSASHTGLEQSNGAAMTGVSALVAVVGGAALLL